MSEISASELYELYLDALQRCTSDLCNRDDEDIEYELFEEFDSGAQSFLHDDSLAMLRQAGYIDDALVRASKEIRAKWLDLQQSSRSVHDVRTKKEWQDLFKMCDCLRMKLRQGPSESADKAN